MFLVIVGPHDSHHAVLSILFFFFFFLFVLLLRGFSVFSVSWPSTSLCHPFPPRARFLAPSPYPIFFVSPLETRATAVSPARVLHTEEGFPSVLPTTLLFFQSGHIVTVNSGPAGVLFLILELSQFC